LKVVPLPQDASSSSNVFLTQSQLGEMGNAERQVVNRALKRLETKGWIRVSYGRIEILDAVAPGTFARMT
jgi:CRP-like cAMP-binding protein